MMIFTKFILSSLISVALAVPVTQEKPSVVHIPLYTKSNQLQRRAVATATLFDAVYSYYATIQVGTPPQNFSVLMDTGSSYLWLQGQECSASDCTFNRYFHSNSSTAVATNYVLNASYADGSGALGNYYLDTISLAGLTLTNQYVGSSSRNGSLEQIVTELQPEGLMGLSFPLPIATPNGNITTNEPFVFELARNNLIPEPVFSYTLGPFAAVVDGGEITLGGVNPTKYTGDINYVPVARETYENRLIYAYWQSFAQDLRVSRSNATVIDSNDIVFTNSSSIYHAIMDTGTTYTYVSAQFALDIYRGVTGYDQPKELDSYGNWQVDCALADSADFIQLSLTHNMDGSADATPLKLRAPIGSFVYAYSSADDSCFWTIYARGTLGGLTDSSLLLGQNFLRNFYVVNNMSEPSMGFAPAVNYKSQVIL